ncbi:LysR family transcriptional regulator [Paraglaciecola arctica]|uniref:LysR family transcriptional regulator n=1 Tax=Paraglaciecola arctica TaxID=1128911 RepID=UPI001C07A639|nr:LysR substrate-binding domain-containing protein [Paraglaciecola arctica]MBU3001791.1 LysR family transcriptional regulator [Paraglaciecola arctica]
MNSKQLKYFLKTADNGSITRAAKVLDIAQPAISQQISSLEHELSVQLFERDFRGVRLTQCGEKFYLRAKSIVHQMAMAKSEIVETESNPSGRISVGMAQAVCNVLAIPLTQAIQNNYPNVELCLHYGTTDFLNQCLSNGQIDLAITYENTVTDKNFSSTPLIKENIYLVVGTEKNKEMYVQLCKRDHIEFKDLAAFEIILPSQTDPLVQMLNRYETQTGVRIWNKQNFGLLMTNLRYVTDGLGLMILPSSAVFHLEKANQVKTISITKPSLKRDVILVSNSKHPTSSAKQVVNNIIFELTKDAHSLGNWRGEILF